MTEHPILFSGAMVRAILEGRKAVTRRVPPDRYLKWKKGDLVKVKETYYAWGKYVKIGEAWCFSWEKDLVIFPDQITPSRPHTNVSRTEVGWHKRPSIFLPIRHCRITLELTEDVYKEPLQAITIADIWKEGICCSDCYPHYNRDPEICGCRSLFINTWNDINVPRGFSWVSNPDVAVIPFRRV